MEILAILRPLLIPIAKIFSILLIIYMAYSHVYNLGVESERERINKEKVELQTKLDNRTDQLIDSSTKYVKASEAMSKASQDTINSIVENMKSKPTVIYKEGKCVVTEDFKKSYNAIIDEANKK